MKTEMKLVQLQMQRVSHKGSSKVSNASNKTRIKGSTNVYFSQDAKKVVKDKKITKLKQTIINAACKK